MEYIVVSPSSSQHQLKLVIYLGVVGQEQSITQYLPYVLESENKLVQRLSVEFLLANQVQVGVSCDRLQTLPPVMLFSPFHNVFVLLVQRLLFAVPASPLATS